MQSFKAECNTNLSAQEKKNKFLPILVGFFVTFFIMNTHTVQAGAFISLAFVVSMFVSSLVYDVLTHKLSAPKILSAGICSILITISIIFLDILVSKYVPFLSMGINRVVYLLCALPSMFLLGPFDSEISISKKLLDVLKVSLFFCISVLVIAFIREFLSSNVSVFQTVAGYPFFAFFLCSYIISFVKRISVKEVSVANDEEAA